MVVHTDCFAYQIVRGREYCDAVEEMDCYECPFYKTTAQLADQLARLEDLWGGTTCTPKSN